MVAGGRTRGPASNRTSIEIPIEIKGLWFLLATMYSAQYMGGAYSKKAMAMKGKWTTLRCIRRQLAFGRIRELHHGGNFGIFKGEGGGGLKKEKVQIKCFRVIVASQWFPFIYGCLSLCTYLFQAGP